MKIEKELFIPICPRCASSNSDIFINDFTPLNSRRCKECGHTGVMPEMTIDAALKFKKELDDKI